MAIYTLTAARDPIAQIARLRGPAHVRAFLDMSLRDIAQRVTDTRAHSEHSISRATWWDWEAGRRSPTADQVRQIEIVLQDAINSELAYDAMLDESKRKCIVRISVGRVWRVRAFMPCVKCGRMYNVTRLQSKRCNRCIAKSKRG